MSQIGTSATRIGVLLMAYGSPRTAAEIEPYYTDIRRGRPPTAEQLEELVERYRQVGGTTPLLEISQAQAGGLQAVLGECYQVFLGMKHWHPYIHEAMAEMQEAGIEMAVGVVLAPHYSRGSIGEYGERATRARESLSYDLDISIVKSWHLNEHYLNAVESHIRTKLTGVSWPEPPTVIFTAHSLPVRVVADGDPYQEQLLETSRALASRLDLSSSQWTFSFQSAGRTSDPWLGPDIIETVNRLADTGTRSILVAPIGFISDHLEIFFDIDHEARACASERGVMLERMDSLNADPELINALADTVRRHINNETVVTSA